MTDLPARREKRPTLAKGFLFILVLALVGAGLAGFALSLRSSEGPMVPRSEPVPLAVSVTPANFLERFDLDARFSGIATAKRESDLGFTTGGRIERFAVDVGDRVKKGDVLAVLDTRGLRAQRRAAQAVIEEAKAASVIAEATLRRQETLLEQGHVSPQRIDEAFAEKQAAEARVQSAEAQAETLSVQIDLARITAPFDGVVTGRFADEGVIAAPSQPVLHLVESGPMEARIGLPADVAARLEAEGAYTLIVDGAPVPAILRSDTGVIDARARTVAAVFEIEAGAGVTSGSVVRLAMQETIDARGLWVPVSALTEVSRGVWSVLVAEPAEGASLARPRPVTIVHTDGARAYVHGAIEEGELIILDGLQRIAPGQPVQPREGAFASRMAGSSE